MRLWLDGQCLQTQHRRVTCGFRTIDLLKRLMQADEHIDLHVSLNAQWLDEAVAARRYLVDNLPMANVQVWQSVVEETTGAISRETPGHRLSRLALTHHINCLAPDLALFPNSFEGSLENSEIAVPPSSSAQSEHCINILPEIDRLFYISIEEIKYIKIFVISKIRKFNKFIIERSETPTETIDMITSNNQELSSHEIHKLNFDHSLTTDILNLLKSFSENKSNQVPELPHNRIPVHSRNKASQDDQTSQSEFSRLCLIDYALYGHTNSQNVAKVMALSELSKSKPSRFLFDATFTLQYNQHMCTGIQRVVRRLSDQLNIDIESHDIEDKLVIFDNKNSTFMEISKNISIANSFVIPHCKDFLILADSNWSIFQFMKSELQRFTLCGSKVITVLYDMIPIHSCGVIEDCHLISFRSYFKFIILNSTAIICISRAVADELYALLNGINFPHKIKIGFWKLGRDALDISKLKLHYPRKSKNLVFITVGTLEIRKGHRVILEAFEELWSKGWNIELKLVGMHGWMVDNFIDKLRLHPELGRRLHWYERLDDHGLVELYANADALILASYAEGFGLPIAEAGYFGKPVIVSDLPVFREVATAAPQAFFFAPGSARDLAAQIRNFSRETRNGQAAKSKPVAWPNWAESMEQLRSVVLKDEYYKIYQPKVKQNSFQTDYIGEIYTQSYLPAASQKYHLRLLNEPHKSECRRFFNIIVFVKNLSDQLYSSNQDLNYKLGIRLGARPAAGNSQVTGYAPTFADIPFVLLPGHQHIMRISCPCVWWQHGVTTVEVDLLQVLPDGCNWWGQSPLRVALPPHGG